MASLQANEVSVLCQRCTAFDAEQQRFCKRFHQEAPFRFDSIDPYQMRDAWHTKIQQMESTMASTAESASLFEVSVPDYKQLKQCKKVSQLNELWDLQHPCLGDHHVEGYQRGGHGRGVQAVCQAHPEP